MIIVVGLGNPEKKYEGTYHNVGFEVIDRVAERLGVSIDKPKFKGLVGETTLDGEKVVLLKPLTYMNLSGESIVLAKNKNKDARILVIVDDIDLPKGNIRYRERGSAGTHNGLRSIVSYIGEDFQRVKVGIGRDISMDLADYVLSKFDKETFAPILDKAAQEVIDRIKA